MCSLLLQCSTGYYQYNIDKNFKGSVKIFEKMGYAVDKDTGKPHYQVLEMKLGQINRDLLASVLVELVFFDLEFNVLFECVEYFRNPNIVLEALEARKNAGGGVDVVIGHLMSKKRDKPMVPQYSPGQRKVNQHQASSHGSGNSSAANESYYTPQGSCRTPVALSNKSQNDSQGSNSPIPYVDPSKLPPPQPEPEPDPSSGNLYSVRHIDASSERDDDDNLIPDSTQLGYRNPPPTYASSAYYGSNMQSYGLQATSKTSEDSTHPKDVYSGGRLPQDRGNYPSAFNQPTDTGASHGRKSQFSSLGSNLDKGSRNFENSEMRHLHVNAQSAGSTAPGSFVRQNSMPADNSSVHFSAGSIVPTDTVTTRTVTPSPVITGSGSRSAVAGGPMLSSIPLNYATGTTNTSGSSSTTSSAAVYTNLPINVEDTSVSTSAFTPTCDGEKPIMITSSTATSAATPEYVNVPIDDQSSLTAPRHGKLDIQNLRKGLAKKKEITKNFDVQSSSEIFTQGENRNLDTLKYDLRRKKETRVKVEDDNMSVERRRKEDSKADYDNIEMYWSQPAGTKSNIKYPLSKPPVSTPRSKDSRMPQLDMKEDHFKLYKPSVETFSLWQCANCKQWNQAYHKECKGCHKMLGHLAVTDSFCNSCNMIILHRHDSDLDNITCARCKGKLYISSIV